MDSQDHTSLPLPTPVSKETQKHFAFTISAAARLAMQDFDTRIKTEVAGQSEIAKKMRKLLRAKYDWKDDVLSIKQSISQLEQDKTLYLELAKHIHSADDLYKAMETIANSQVEDLLFHHNNFPLATLRHDQFVHFLGTVFDALRDEGLIAGKDHRFDAIVTGYHCAMLGYDSLREEVKKRSKKQYASLLEWTGASATDPETEELNEKKFVQLINRRYRSIFRDWGLNIQGEKLVPVAYAYLANLAEKISVQQTLNEHPEITDTEDLKRLAVEHRKELLQNMTQFHTNLFSLAQVAEVEHYLLDAYAAAFHLPRNFSQLTKQSAAMAQERAEAALPRLERQATQHLSSVHTPGRDKLEAAGMLPYTPEILQALSKSWFKEISQELAAAHNLNEIIQVFQDDADKAILECSCGLQHPGVILLRRSYVEAFGKSLEAQWKEQIASDVAPSYDMRAVRQSFDALAHKYDQAYECYWDIANWCLRVTNGAYSDFGQLTLNVEMATHGKNFKTLTREEYLTASQDARECIIEYAKENGVPKAWAEHPLMPRLYQATLAHSVEQENRRIAADFSLFPNDRSRTTPWNEAEQAKIKQATIDAESVIDTKQHDLLQAIVQQFPSGYPDRFGRSAPSLEKIAAPYDTTPYIDAVTLARIHNLIELDRPKGRQH